MSGSVNKCIIVGNVGKEPDIRRTQDGRPIASLSIATSERWTDKGSGERRERTEWHRVVIYSEPLCKVVEQYVKKGAKLYIEGSLQTRKWTDQQGQDRYSTEIVLQGYGGTLVMLDGPRVTDSERMVRAAMADPAPTPFDGSATRQPAKAASKTYDDEIPF